MFKKQNLKKTLLISLITLVFLSISLAIYFSYINHNTQPEEIETVTQPNIILLIGDGMGTEHLKYIKTYENKLEQGYIFETCPNTLVTTNSATQGSPTDSAAAATAIATGHKVYNRVLSIEDPGSKKDLETILEILKAEGYLTGLITTTEITHATPAAFSSHTDSRTNTEDILEDYFSTKPDIIFGGLVEQYLEYITPDYSVVENYSDLISSVSIPIIGVFGDGGHMPYVDDRESSVPSLRDMTFEAISLLENTSKPFFLMIEGGRIDHASHSNDTEKLTYELEEFMNVVEYVYRWARVDSNTVVIVTADHETGGLEVLTGVENNFPEVSWSTTGHTDSKVPLYICFDENVDINGIIDNTDIFKYMNSIDGN